MTVNAMQAAFAEYQKVIEEATKRYTDSVVTAEKVLVDAVVSASKSQADFSPPETSGNTVPDSTVRLDIPEDKVLMDKAVYETVLENAKRVDELVKAHPTMFAGVLKAV